MTTCRARTIAAMGLACLPLGLWASSTTSIATLKLLTIDELLTVEVTSVSRRVEPRDEAAAALAVVPQEHIRRSGATTVPDALRGVPGLHVARRNANSWGISSRGFSSTNSEKLLVQSDTRSIYTPLFSGVFWDVQDYLFSDIERIEVIRGPGATLWGSNAVNGIINITTKSAADTHGSRLEVLAGTNERMVSFRQGAQSAAGLHYRVFGKYLSRDGTRHTGLTEDDGALAHVGFRTDWSDGADTDFTVQGDLYRGEMGQLAPAVTIIGRPGPTGDLVAEVSGGNLLARWQRRFPGGSELQVRAYYDRTHRDDPSFIDDLDTFDIDAQHRFSPLERHDVLWGLNYRYLANESRGRGIFAVEPAASEDQVFSAFLQDRITLRENLHLTIGTKAEHNDFSGFELQPSIRALWEFSPGRSLWAAASRAARIPTRIERDIFIDVSDPAANPLIRLLGNRDFAAEELTAYELGLRWRVSPNLHLDIAAFDNRYDGLASLELGSSSTLPDGRTLVPIFHQNLNAGRARGIETVAHLSLTENWRITASHSYLRLEIDSRGMDINRSRFYEGATPRHQFALSSYFTLSDILEFDVHFRHVGRLRQLPQIVTGEGIPGYEEIDVHLAWQVSPAFRISLVGRNLLNDDHIEIGAEAARGPIPRSAYLKLSWDF